MKDTSEYIQIGYAVAQGPHSFAVGKQVAQDALQKITSYTPSVVLVFASVHYNLDELLSGIGSVIFDVPVLGTTTAGEIYNKPLSSSAVVVIIASSYLRVRIGVGQNVSANWKEAVQEAVNSTEIKQYFSGNDDETWSEMTRHGKTSFCLLFSPGNTRHSDSQSFEILAELQRLSGNRIPFFGGCSADDWKMETNSVLYGNQVYPDSLLVAVFETSLKFGLAMEHGFLPSNQQVLATKVKGQKAIELNYKRAADVYAKMLGSDAEALKDKHLTLTSGRPCGIHDMLDQYRIIVASYFNSAGEVRFSQPIIENTSINLMDAKSENLIKAGREALHKAILRGQIKRPVMAIAFSCALRQRILGNELPEEIASMQELIPGLPIIGFYSFGEQGMMDAGVSCHGNGNITILVLSDELSASAEVALENQRLLASQKEHEAFLDAIIENIPDMIFLKDAQRLQFVRFNKAGEELLGHSREEMIGKNDYDFFTKEQADFFTQKDRNVLNEKRLFDIPEEEIQTKWKGKRILHTKKIPILDKKGQPQFLLGISEDITDRKQAERNLLESEERFKALHNASFGGIAIHDKGFILGCNQGLEELSGYSMDELIGMDGLLLIAPESRDLVMKNILAGYEKAYEAQGIRKNGEIFPIRLEARNIPYKGKTVRSVEFRDITDQKEYEAEREMLQKQLLQAQKLESVGRLAGGVAHDFNNMLSVILGHTELLQKKLSPLSPIQEGLTEIYEAAKRSAELTRQLLAFARKQTIAPRLLDLNEAVAGTLKMIQRLIGEDIDLVWLPNPHLWTVMIDPSQLDQLLANLCVNARDAIAGTGKLTIETDNVHFDDAYCVSHSGYLSGDYALLAISDNGCGMDKETLQHIFEPFYTTKEMGKGTGLGLATVYGIVRQHNGFLNVYSEVGEGTTFRIYLPRQKNNIEPDIIHKLTKGVIRGSETILVVEDELAILDLIQQMLESLGYIVLAVNTPSDAIKTAEKHSTHIDLLITDVVMPEMNGLQLATKLVSLCPQIKTLYMSGYTANVIAHHGVLDPGVAFIGKPFSYNDLVSKVRELLDIAKIMQL